MDWTGRNSLFVFFSISRTSSIAMRYLCCYAVSILDYSEDIFVERRRIWSINEQYIPATSIALRNQRTLHNKMIINHINTSWKVNLISLFQEIFTKFQRFPSLKISKKTTSFKDSYPLKVILSYQKIPVCFWDYYSKHHSSYHYQTISLYICQLCCDWEWYRLRWNISRFWSVFSDGRPLFGMISILRIIFGSTQCLLPTSILLYMELIKIGGYVEV